MNEKLRKASLVTILLGKLAIPFIVESSHERENITSDYPNTRPSSNAYSVYEQPDRDVYFVCEDCTEETN